MKKEIAILVFAISAFLLVSCAGKDEGSEAAENKPQTKQELETLFEKRCSADEALSLSKASDTVVFETRGCTSGKETWDAFYKAAAEGKPAAVLCAYYYVLDKERVSAELYEEEKDLYPQLFFYLLEYDGAKYSVSVRKSDEENLDRQESFPYLQHFTGEAPSTALYTAYDNYVLVDDLTATWEGITKAWVSSQAAEGYRCCSVYQDCIGWKEAEAQ